LNPGPSGEDAEVSANLAMSDHSVPRRMDLPTSGPKVLSISLIWLIRAPSARTGASSRRSIMAVHYIRPNHGELRDPFDCDEQVVKTLVTVGAFVALADGRLDAIERDEAVGYIDRQHLAPSISRRRIADFFDAQAHHLEGRNFGDLIVEALRPIAALSLAFDVVRIAELVAAADQHVDPNEAQVIRLIRLIAVTSSDPKVVNPPRSSGTSIHRQERDG
jgi:tellurite resistance protein TerB